MNIFFIFNSVDRRRGGINKSFDTDTANFPMLRRIKKTPIPFSASVEINKLVRSCPSSATLYACSNRTKHKLGRVTFLRKNRKLYTIGSKFYVTPDKQLKYKANSSLIGLIIILRFSGKTCFYSIECKVIDKIIFQSKAEDYDSLQQYAFALLWHRRKPKSSRGGLHRL